MSSVSPINPLPRSARHGVTAIALLFLVFVGAIHATPLQHDLGHNLAYHRAHTLPDDLPAATAKAQPLVLDLRFTIAGDGAAQALAIWLRSHATRATPVIVLVNAETPRALHPVFAALTSQTGLLTIGSPASGFIPDISLAIPLEAERRAYQALEQGVSLETLLRENTDKPRRDEAAIMRERDNPPEEIPEEELTDEELTENPASAKETKTAAPPPLIDKALQRAVQLHRALLALKRL